MSKGKAKILDMESILSLDKLEIFQLTYVKIKEAKCSMVYAPLFGTDLNFIKRLLEWKYLVWRVNKELKKI